LDSGCIEIADLVQLMSLSAISFGTDYCIKASFLQ